MAAETLVAFSIAVRLILRNHVDLCDVRTDASVLMLWRQETYVLFFTYEVYVVRFLVLAESLS